MRLSIFDSKRSALTYAKLLLLACVLVFFILEASSYYLLNHFSLTYQRIARQYQEAIGIRRARSGERPSVLLVGNSLLLHGIQLDRLESLTSTRMQIFPIFLEATGYYDWLYGLRKLFHDGARPDVVIVGVGEEYFLANSIRQDYAPKLFFDGRDTLALASDLRLDRTATSNLWLAHLSAFWDTRTAIRTQVLNHIVPHLEDLFLLLGPRPSIPQGPEFDAIVVPRLRRLRELCDAHGAKLIVLIPPTLSSRGAIAEMIDAARKTDVSLSVPIDPAVLSAHFYQRDGIHLNPDGAVLFTSALAKDLPERVGIHNLAASAQTPNPELPVSTH